MGTNSRTQKAWLNAHRDSIPSLIALLGVAVFWAIGAIGGISYLHNASSPISMLSGLYIMLAAVALSIIITTLALNYLIQHFSRQRTQLHAPSP